MTTGEDWFRKQPPAVQRRLIGNEDAYQAYRRGEIELSDFVGEEHSEQWGTSIYQKSGARVLRESTDPQQEIVNQLRSCALDAPVVLGGVPDPLQRESLWEDRFSDDIVLTPVRWNHIRSGGRRIVGYEQDVVRTIRTPGRIAEDKSYPERAVLYGMLEDDWEMLVVVERKRAVSATDNQVITAFAIPRQEVKRRKKLERPIWRGE